jgi:hypothetical protein
VILSKRKLTVYTIDGGLPDYIADSEHHRRWAKMIEGAGGSLRVARNDYNWL